MGVTGASVTPTATLAAVTSPDEPEDGLSRKLRRRLGSRQADRPPRPLAGRRHPDAGELGQPDHLDRAPGHLGGRRAVRGRAARLPRPRRLPRQQRRRPVVPRLRLLRDRLAVDHRLRRHHAGERVRPAGQHPGHHPAAGPVPHRPGRYHARGAHRALPAGVQAATMEVEGARSRGGRRLRHQGPVGGQLGALRRRRAGAHRRGGHRPVHARRRVRAGAGHRARLRHPIGRAAGRRRAARPGGRRGREPGRLGGAGHADRARARAEGADRGGRAGGGERPPAAPVRREPGGGVERDGRAGCSAWPPTRRPSWTWSRT